LAATLADAKGSVASATVWLQKSANGSKWTNLAQLKTNSSGKTSKVLGVTKKGTTYYRWYSPATAQHLPAWTAKQKVRVK
jgi:hypothetical protein